MQFVVERAQPAAERFPDLGVERAERFVEQQHVRLDGESAGKGDALALAAGKLVGIAVREPLDLHEFKQLVHAFSDFSLGFSLFSRTHAQAERDIFKNRHVPEKGVMLENKADISFFHVEVHRVGAVKIDLALVGPFEPRDDAQKRGLARAGRTE